MIALLALSAHAMPLRAAVARALEDPALQGASVSVVIGPHVAIDADRRLVPASVTKFLTAAAALEALGPDAVLETRLGHTGAVVDGVLTGDLVVTGGGDPSLGDPDPAEAVGRLVDLVAAAGITRVEGRVLADGGAFLGPALGRGWMWDDLDEPWSGPVTALAIGHNLAPEGAEGDACAGVDGPGTPLADPLACAVSRVADALAARGIAVSAGAATVRPGEPSPAPTPLGAISSAPLRELLRHTLETSDNLYAECLWRLADASPPHAPDDARAAVGALLTAVGSPDAPPVDGSGLSRYSLISARTLARVAEHARARPYGPALREALPVAGRTGTLAERLRGTPAEGRVAAKTGSMSGVRNLVGYVDDAGGASHAFALLFSGFLADQASAIAVQDRILALAAASADGRVPRAEVRRRLP